MEDLTPAEIEAIKAKCAVREPAIPAGMLDWERSRHRLARRQTA